jgi:ribonuclease-3
MSDLLSQKLGYEFKRHNLMRHALTHMSFVHEQKLTPDDSNERLEFLGDAVLELCISDFLYHKYPEMPEGELTKKRAALVCEDTLARLARGLSLGDFLLLGQGEAGEGGRDKPSILADAFEAVLGALYLDGGMQIVQNLIQRLFAPLADNATRVQKDYKSTLQEILQKSSRETAMYEIVNEEGPPHRRAFTAVAVFQGRVLGEGTGASKKSAEQAAAAQALKSLE